MTREELIQKLQGLAPMSHRVDQLFKTQQQIIQQHPYNPEFQIKSRLIKILYLFPAYVILSTAALPFMGITKRSSEAYFIISAIVFIGMFPLSKILIKLTTRQVNKFRQNQNLEIQKQREIELSPSNKEIEAVTADINAYCAGWWPISYTYIQAVSECLELLATYRANSVQECINLYEQIKHQQRLEAQNNQNLRLQMEINDAQQQIIQEQRVGNQISTIGNIINAAGHAATQEAIRKNPTRIINNYF